VPGRPRSRFIANYTAVPGHPSELGPCQLTAHQASSDTESAYASSWIYPDMMSTYGGRANMDPRPPGGAAGLRPRRRGAFGTSRCTKADIYLLGGGEGRPAGPGAQRPLTTPRRPWSGTKAVRPTAAVVRAWRRVPVCSAAFVFGKGAKHAGLELLDITSDSRRQHPGPSGTRGDIDPDPSCRRWTGVRQHGGRTRLGPRGENVCTGTEGICKDGHDRGAHGREASSARTSTAPPVANQALADLL